MSISRRDLLQAGVWSTIGAVTATQVNGSGPAADPSPQTEALDRAAAEPVLRVPEKLDRPVTIERMELLKNGREYLVRVRSSDGAEGIAATSSGRMAEAYPLFLRRVAPFFEGKDARQLEPLLWDLYRYRSNYKYQGILLWVALAGAEIAILDMLGRLTGEPIGELIGGVKQRDIAVYRASGHRDNTAEQEAAYLKRLVDQTGFQAVKLRVGGRMNRNRDSRPGRSEALIPLARKTLGPEVTIYADSNSSYDVTHAVRIGRMMQEHDYGFFEEPVRFDHLEETRRVTEQLEIPIAWGEEEFSIWRFRWMIHHRGVDIVQPDLHYFGGFIRSMRVARMAAQVGIPCAPHMSGWGLGYLDMLHFVSAMPEPAAHHEYKGPSDIPIECSTSSLRPVGGAIRVPSGPGLGVEIDSDYLDEAERVKL